jgi:hypothetical protein
VSRRRRGTDQPDQLSLPTTSASKSRQRITPAPEQAAKAYITPRAKPSVVPGHKKLTFTLDIPRELAERLECPCYPRWRESRRGGNQRARDRRYNEVMIRARPNQVRSAALSEAA